MKKIIYIILFIAIILTTIVYSAFSTKLQIGGDLIVRSDNDIRVTNLSIKESINGAYETYNNKYTKDTTSMFVTLPSNSSITYEVEVTNKTDDIYKLSCLDELTSLNSNLTYVIDTEQYDIYDSNSIRKVTITISNNSDETISGSLVLEYKFDIAYSMFIKGREFNSKIKTLAGNTDATTETEDTNITSIVRSDTLSANVTEDNIISTSDSTVPIYVWYDNGTIYYYTKYYRPLMNYDGIQMFTHLSSVESIDLDTVDTSKTTDMDHIFAYSLATEIKGIDKFDTSNVTRMSYMFIQTNTMILDISNFDTSKVTSMHSMFQWCKATSIDVSNWDTSKVTDMVYMFMGTKVTELDVSNFDTSEVTSMNSMFWDAKVTTIDVSNWDTSKVTNMSSMFANSHIKIIDVSRWDTSNVTDMNSMFRSTQPTILDLSNFDTSKVTNMSDMFNYSNAKTIYASDKFITDNVTESTNNMFYNATKLVGGNGTKYDSSHTDKEYARIDTEDTPGYFTLKED